MLTQEFEALALVFNFQLQYLYKITRMYKYGKELRGWIEDEDELMELWEVKLHSLCTVLHITDIHLLHSAKHLQVDFRTCFCCLSAHVFVVYQKRFHRLRLSSSHREDDKNYIQQFSLCLELCCIVFPKQWRVEWLVSASDDKQVIHRIQDDRRVVDDMICMLCVNSTMWSDMGETDPVMWLTRIHHYEVFLLGRLAAFPAVPIVTV